MPRETRQQFSSRPQVTEGSRGTPSLDVVQPLAVRRRESATAAQEIAASLGIFQKPLEAAFERRDKNQAARAVAAVEAGEIREFSDVPDGIGNSAYAKAARVALGNQKRILFEEELDSQVAEIIQGDPDITPEELDAIIDERVSGFLMDDSGRFRPGFDTTEVLETVLPQVERLRAEVLTKRFEEVRAETDAQVKDAIVAGADDEFTRTGALDFGAIHSQVRATSRTGTEANEMLFGIYSSLAIQHGMPELLESVPDKTADGTPSFKHSAALRQKYVAALNTAHNRKEAKQAEAAAEAAAAEKALKEQTASERTSQVLQGADVTAALISDLGTGRIEDGAARAIFGLQDQARKRSEEGEVDYAWISGFTLQVASGDIPAADAYALVREFGSQGGLGTGSALRGNVESLERMIDRAKRYREGADPQIKQVESILKGEYPADSPFIQLQGDVRNLRTAALIRYQELIEDGMDPFEARVRVRNDLPPPSGAAGSVASEERVLSAMINGDIRSLRSMGATADTVNQAVASGQLDEDTAILLLSNL